MVEDAVVSAIRKEYIYRLVADGKRLDGRRPDEIRPTVVETGFVTSAEGSSRVKMGATDVLVGVKIEPGTPFPDTPDRGVLTTNAELVPMASPSFESGPPSPSSIELARVVDRGIRESGAIDFTKLCIKAGEKVWVVYIDIHVLDYDGNYFDAAALAAITALSESTVSASKHKLGENYRLPVHHFPVATTAVKLGKAILLDPGREEEATAQARLMVTTDENGDIRAMQKGGGGFFTVDEVKSIIKMAQNTGREIRQKLNLPISKGV